MTKTPFIIVVDDDPEDRETLAFSFSQVNNEVQIKYVNSGTQLLDLLDESDPQDYPDLIVLDYNMPEQNGREILEQIKSNPFIKNIPVLIYTTTVTAAMRSDLQSLNALHCMEKSKDAKKLIEQARYFLELV